MPFISFYDKFLKVSRHAQQARCPMHEVLPAGIASARLGHDLHCAQDDQERQDTRVPFISLSGEDFNFLRSHDMHSRPNVLPREGLPAGVASARLGHDLCCAQD